MLEPAAFGVSSIVGREMKGVAMPPTVEEAAERSGWRDRALIGLLLLGRYRRRCGGIRQVVLRTPSVRERSFAISEVCLL